jgi:hypothetical protein
MADQEPGRNDKAEAEPQSVSKPARRPRPARPVRFSFTVVLTLLVLGLGLGYMTLAHTGAALRMPTAMVAEVEARVNRSLIGARLPAGTAVSLGSVELAVEEDFVPRFRLADIRSSRQP